MCILKLLRLHIFQKHRRQINANYINSRDFYTFQRLPFRSHFAFPEMVNVNTDDEIDEFETLTTSLLESKCSDFIFKGNMCDCQHFRENVVENEER